MLSRAEVTLINGQRVLRPILFTNTIKSVSAKDMFEANCTPPDYLDEKAKIVGSAISITLDRIQNILARLDLNNRRYHFLCDFSMGTQNLFENFYAKLIHKNVYMMIANNLKVESAGFNKIQML